MPRTRVLALLVVTAGLFAGCAVKYEPATAADRELAASLATAGEGVPEYASRETLNHTRTPDGLRNVAMLKGEARATPKEMAEARRYVGDKVKAVKSYRDWPAPASIAIKKRAGEIKLDGKGDDAAWAAATAVPIAFPAGKRVPAQRAIATCKLLWDEQNLYLLFDVPDTNIVSPFVARDQDVWFADCTEFFITPSQRWGQYWELNFSPTGVIYDSLCAKYRDVWYSYLGIDQNMDGLRVATSIRGTLNVESDTDDGYTIEVAIPWSQVPGLDRGVRTGDRFYGLIGHADRDKNGPAGAMSWYAHLPITGWFHNIWGHGAMTLEP